MLDTAFQSRRNWTQWLSVTVTTAALSAAALLLVMYLLAAVDWYDQGFMGILPLRNLQPTDNQAISDQDWPAQDTRLRTSDRIMAVAGVDLDSLAVGDRVAQYNEVLSQYKAGDTVPLRILRETETPGDFPTDAACNLVPGESNLYTCTTTVQLDEMPLGDMVGYFGAGWVAGVALWLLAAFLLVRQWHNPQARYLVMLSAAMAVFLAGRFDTISTHRMAWAWFVATGLCGGLLVLVGLEFPYRFALVLRSPAWQLGPLLVGLALGAAGIALYETNDPALNRASYGFAVGVLLLGAFIMSLMMLFRRARAVSPIVRNQSTMLLYGMTPALLPTLVTWILATVGSTSHDQLVLVNQVLPVLLPLTAVFAALQFRVVDTDRLITQSVLYSLMIGLLTLSYWLIVVGVALLVGRSTSDTALNPALIVLSIFILAIAFTPLRAFLQRLIDATYFRARRAYQTYLEQFSREVTHAVTLSEVEHLTRTTLEETLAPTHSLLFVRNPAANAYVAHHDSSTNQRPTDVVFGLESGLINYLRERADLLYLEEGRPLPLDVVSDRAKLGVLASPVIVGLRGQRALNGFLAIGRRQGGAAYRHEDLRFIENLGDQVALAVERAQAVEDLERRVRVQDVLSQVSRALNFAIDFDTLLELIYAQTLRVIDAPCFYIATKDPNIDELMYVFYNEGDERIEQFEGKRWRMGRDLMSEIARAQQTLRTDDFVRETLARDPNATPENSQLKAWMGVPLLADTGEGVLGVMIAATTEPGLIFTDEQQDLFWDIANLAASAIDKLQLFDKTQQRARQLGAINQISSQLASEMGSVDRLLRLITENAVTILNTEAGSLLLVDEESGDLEFHVVVGGSEDLVGTRIPAGSGVVGVTVQQRRSIIVNDPARDSRWYGDIRSTSEHDAPTSGGNGHGDPDNPSSDESSEQSDFRSNALLSVPLLAQGGRAIGVLQMVNKRDGSIFVQEDADLLETFAGQAAIAIENARLFDMTDQQLALRVQELDTMQRIDQELNRTLNLDNVVDITMDWAMRKSGATAGALFILDRERNELLIVASYGYESFSPLHTLPGDIVAYPADRGVVGRVVRSGQPSLITDVNIDPNYDETLPGCVAQLVVPLFSANRVMGVIILESNQEGELDLLDLDFVARLAEHASPAIVNSQLFQELERANEAKSEFVSFVAHELKNPMTSMKGYTDLLLKGVVGPVNEQQSDFLNTIFNNVNRMETLVSDLNDLTKQQTNNLRLEIFPVDFRNVVMETLRAHQSLIEEKNQELVLDVPDNLPLVLGDQHRLIQIMVNFLSNAFKYTPPEGTISIQARVSRNRWDPQGPPEVIHCLVRDTGIGMSPEDLEQLFTPYFRSENPKTREQPGTGLGLTITKGLIELHGGRIWVESELEVGTTFHFTVPVATESATQAATEGAATGA